MNVFALLALLALADAPPNLDEANRLYPDADAVILSWEQTFAQRPDGTRARRDRRFVLLRDSRAYGRYADQRIDWREGADRLTIRAARTHLAGGGILEVPIYGINVASPGGLCGWPAFAEWRQTIVSFQGLSPGAVVELDYEVEEGPGGPPFLSADLRIGERDPTVLRDVEVILPEGVPLSAECHWIECGRDGNRFTFGKVAGTVDEPFSPPWQTRCGWLRFTTCPDEKAFAASFLDPARAAAIPDDAVKAFAAEAAGDEPDPLRRLEKLAAKVGSAITIVDSPRILAVPKYRRASEVLASAYGSGPEAAILLAACLEALGIEGMLWLALDPVTRVPNGLVVMSDSVILHPPHGPETPETLRADVSLESVQGDQWLSETRYARDSYSGIRATGVLTLDEEGRLSGELRVVLTGRFFDPAAVRDGKAREGFLRSLAGRLVTGLELKAEALEALDGRKLVARLTVTSAPLGRLAGRFLLEFGPGPLLLDAFPIPLAAAERRTMFALPGAVREEIEILVRLPEKFSTEPLRLSRDVEISGRKTPSEFMTLCGELNALRAPAARVFLVGSR